MVTGVRISGSNSAETISSYHYRLLYTSTVHIIQSIIDDSFRTRVRMNVRTRVFLPACFPR